MFNEIASDWKTLVPGEQVEIPGAVGKYVVVYPLAIEHLVRFRSEVAAIYGAIKGIEVPSGPEATASLGMAYAQAVIPVLTGRAFTLLSECCNPRLEGAPVYILPLVAEAWIRQTFGEGRLDPWLAAAKKLMQLTGTPSLSALLSKLLSRPDTPSPKSPTTVSEVLADVKSRMSGGHSPSSATT